MLGFLYKDNKNKSSLGHTFEGLTGHETNPDSNGNAIQVFQIDPDDPNAYFMPNKDPGEGFGNTNFQLFGAASAPYPKGIANNQGFVRDFEDPLNNAPFEREEHPCTKSTTHKDSSIQRMIIKVMLIKNGIKNRVHLDILQMFPS